MRISPFLVSFTVTCVFFINFCAWIFQCGCRSLWAGADAACNIHTHGAHHCPWCSHGVAGQAIVMIAMCAPQLAVSLKAPWSWPVRTLVALAMFPAAGALAGLAFGLAGAYWTR